MTLALLVLVIVTTLLALAAIGCLGMALYIQLLMGLRRDDARSETRPQ